MSKYFYGANISQILSKNNIKYAVSIGRRAPMHVMHLDCIKEIQEANIIPICIIGSDNDVNNIFYDAIKNPLTLNQQKEQFYIACPEVTIRSLQDFQNINDWYNAILDIIQKIDVNANFAIHFRAKNCDLNKDKDLIKPLKSYIDGFLAHNIYVWESYNLDISNDNINASDLRKLDLNNLTQNQYNMFATPDYIIDIANLARENNQDKNLLKNLPVTMLDLSLERLFIEKNIRTKDFLQKYKFQ